MPGFPFAGVSYKDLTNIREDVSDIIYQITPEDTPFFTMVGDTTAENIHHEWNERALSTRNHNAQPEGFTFTFTTATNTPDRIGNRTQILSKDVRVSDTQQNVMRHAIGDLFADQMALRSVELKTDVEHALIQGTLHSGATVTNERQMQGILQALISNVSTYTVATETSLSETLFNDATNVSWDLGGEPRDVLVKGRAKRKISTFTAQATPFIASDQMRTVNTISMYQGDFFPQTIHLSRDIVESATLSDVLWIDKTMIAKAFLEPFISEKAPRTAKSQDGVLSVELSLEYGNADAHYLIRDVQTNL